ncbi:uncharacterized protein LOC120353634 [Nilaparvata lugens]|uniref:uncharacterized protein LOC120353634 n=1 Tax=Nilaparvata lugens TaxID=108931 RepID=UPI00193C899A|nr:uncharacterized protein LOC120353634 [Nilaparvata lugens]
MSNCIKCSKSVSRSSKDKVECQVCRAFYHGSCVGLGDAEISVLSELGKVWTCEPCGRERRLSRSLSDGDSVLCDVTSTDSIKNMISSLSKKVDDGLKRLEKDLGASLDLCHSKLDESSKLSANQLLLIEKQNELIETLRVENLGLTKKVAELTERLDDVEQYSRANTLEIYGVPSSINENVAQTVIGVGKALDLAITEDMIDVCHRLKQLNNRPSSGIIVRFVRRTDKEQFLARRRIKRTLSTRHLGLSTDSPIYVNQSLSQRRRVLFAKAKKIKNDCGFKFLWVDRTGNIKMRKVEGSVIHTIKSDSDLAKLSVSVTNVEPGNSVK